MNNCLEILKDLLRFPSFTTEGVNALSKHIIKHYLEPENIPYHKIPSGDRTNLLVFVNKDFSDNQSSGLVMSGHLDTVEGYIPVKEENGKLYGRGTVDMLFFTAVLLSLIPYFKTLPYPVLFSLTADEETTFLGIEAVLKFCQENRIQPKYCILGEPTDFALTLNNQGTLVFDTTFQGKAAHSSMPKLGSNAIETAVAFINLLKQNADINDNPDNSITYNIAKIKAGVADNIIPDTCSLLYSFRFSNPTEEALIRRIQAKTEQAVYQQSKLPITTTTPLYIKSFDNKGSPLAKRITSALPEIRIQPFSGATEAGYWHEYGADTLVFGINDQKMSHTENEHIPIQSLQTYAEQLKVICNALCPPTKALDCTVNVFDNERIADQ